MGEDIFKSNSRCMYGVEQMISIIKKFNKEDFQ